MYFAVIYCKDKTIHLWQNESKEECEKKLLDVLKNKRVYDRVERTTIIKRDIKENDYVFGCPNSLNMKDKFDKLLKKHKIDFERG